MLFPLKIKKSNSVFWEYVLVCTTLALISCLCMGMLLGINYTRTINSRNEQAVQSQAARAITSLETQLESMHHISLQLSINRIYRSDYALGDAVNTMTVARAFSQHAPFCPLANRIALMYLTENDVYLYQQDGTTTDLDVFLKRFELTDNAIVRDFLFTQEKGGRVLRTATGFLVAYPVTAGAGKVESTLCFAVLNEDLHNYIRMSSALEPSEYRLVYQNTELLSAQLPKNTVSFGDTESFRIDAAVPELSLLSLVTTPADALSLAGCLLLLFVSIFALAWRCYRPIRSLSRKYATGTTDGIKNELLRLDQIIAQTKSRSLLLDKKASDQSALLQDYVMLMLLNNSGTMTIAQDLVNVGISFPYSHFAVITLTPCKDQVITQDNMDTLQQYIDDIAEDIGAMQAVECSRASHVLAIVCNPEKTELYDVLVQRLHTYLNAQGRRFLVGVGPLTDTLAGVSASYLTALSHLRTLADAQPGMSIPMQDNPADSSALINRIISQIERGDCQQALVNLDAYMESIEQNQSELIRRYNVMNITFAIQQLCNKLNFQLTESQMSMLLSMRSVRTIHFALLQLIPSLCIHAEQQNEQAILPTGRLVMDYLNAHFCDYDITVQQVAEAVGIGINRASAIIREETGHSFKTVLTQLRIDHAKKLLSAGMSVADVGSQVGYSSASYFIKVFKSAEGMTPDAYRKGRFRDEEDPAQETEE